MASMVDSWVVQRSLEISAWLRTSTESAQVAQSVEHVLGKDEVGGSIPLLGFCPDWILLYAQELGFQTTVQP